MSYLLCFFIPLELAFDVGLSALQGRWRSLSSETLEGVYGLASFAALSKFQVNNNVS